MIKYNAKLLLFNVARFFHENSFLAHHFSEIKLIYLGQLNQNIFFKFYINLKSY